MVIVWDNVEEDKKSNFKTYIEKGYRGFDDGDFDFNSRMMYVNTAFSKNGQPTITRKDGSSYQIQYDSLSDGDLQIINKMYPFTNQVAKN